MGGDGMYTTSSADHPPDLRYKNNTKTQKKEERERENEKLASSEREKMSAFVVLGIRGLMWAAERIVASRAPAKQEQPPATAVAKPERTIATARPGSEGAVNGSMQESRIEEATRRTERLSQMDGRVKKKIGSWLEACRIEAKSGAPSGEARHPNGGGAPSGEARHPNGGEDDGFASSSKLSADRVVEATVEPGAEAGIKETTGEEPRVSRLSEPGGRQERGAVEVKKSREKGDGLKVSQILSCVVRACGGKLTPAGTCLAVDW